MRRRIVFSCLVLCSAMFGPIAFAAAPPSCTNVVRDPIFQRDFTEWDHTAKTFDDGNDVLVTREGRASSKCPTKAAPKGPPGGTGSMAAIGTKENSTIRQYIQTTPGTMYSWSVLLFGDSYGTSADNLFQMVWTTRDDEAGGKECAVQSNRKEERWERISCFFIANNSETLIKYRARDRQCYLFFTDSVVRPADCPPPPSNAVLKPADGSKSNLYLVGIVGFSLLGLAALMTACICLCYLRRLRKRGPGVRGKRGGKLWNFKKNATAFAAANSSSSPMLKSAVKAYSYEELEAATGGFTFPLGGGGSATVYRAVLEGEPVAVKRLKLPAERNSSEKEFLSEVRSLAQLRHVNLVSLRGYSVDVGKPKLLIYDFIPGGTLKSLLHGTPTVPLSLSERMRMAYGIARGMEYCHHLIPEPLMHRDLKPDNILLTSRDAAGIPKISDFGLAKIVKPEDRTLAPISFPQGPERGGIELPPLVGEVSTSSMCSMVPMLSSSSSHHSATSSTSFISLPSITAIAGTAGYIDPEYFTSGIVTRKSDVYGFGMVLLELITRTSPSSMYGLWSQDSMAEGQGTGAQGGGPGCFARWCENLLDKGEDDMARVLGFNGGPGEAMQCYEAMRIAHHCLQDLGKDRPSMHEVVRMFENHVGIR